MDYGKDKRKSKIKFSWRTISMVITAICAIFSVLYPYILTDPIAPFSSFIKMIQTPPQEKIPKKFEELTKMYRQYWEIYGVRCQHQYAVIYMFNNSQYYLVNILIEFTLIVDEDTPLKKNNVIGFEKRLSKEILIIKKGQYKPIPIADIGPFYSGKISWKITADDPTNIGKRIVLDKRNLMFNNSKYYNKIN